MRRAARKAIDAGKGIQPKKEALSPQNIGIEDFTRRSGSHHGYLTQGPLRIKCSVSPPRINPMPEHCQNRPNPHDNREGYRTA